MSRIIKVILDKVEKNSYNISIEARGGLMFLELALPWIIGIICLAAVLLIAIVWTVVSVWFRKKGKPGRVKVDEAFIQGLLKNYGGAENIREICVDNARLKITVADLDKVNLPALKEISQSGVFVTGSVIKTLFKYDSKAIKGSLEKII